MHSFSHLEKKMAAKSFRTTVLLGSKIFYYHNINKLNIYVVISGSYYYFMSLQWLRHRKKEKTVICLFTSQIPGRLRLNQGKARICVLSLFRSAVRLAGTHPSRRIIPFGLLRCLLAENWNQEQMWKPNEGSRLRTISLPRNVSTTAKTAHPDVMFQYTKLIYTY